MIANFCLIIQEKMNYLVSEKNKTNGKTAGNKARQDVEKILLNNNFRHIELYKPGDKKVIVIFKLIIVCIKLFLKVRKNEIVFFQHPYIPYLYSSSLSIISIILRKIKKAKTIVLIHDLNSVRISNLSINTEIRQLNSYSYVICHNDSMKRFLEKNGCDKNIFSIELFDYLSDDILLKEKNNTIAIAGNLCKEKSGYIYSLGDIDCIFSLYGIGVIEQELPSNVIYEGSYNPDILPSIINGKWGLVWDGNSIESCKGSNGEYLKLNNPHKLSLYLASGIPVIVWNDSAMAEYVKKNRIGIVINNIMEINEIVRKISTDEYNKICQNVLNIRKDILLGNFLNRVINQIQIY